jgi:hypothetical protein
MTVRARPTTVVPYLLAFVLGLGTAGLAACGGKSNPAMIPATNADQLRGDLDAVLSAVESHNCNDADKAIAQVKSDLLELPSGTSKRLQDRLAEGVAKLTEQSAQECKPKTTTTATTAPTTTATVQTVTTTAPPVTTATETTPTTVPTTPTTPTTPPITTAPQDTGGATTP